VKKIKSYYREILFFLGFVVLSLLLTYPLIFRMGSSFYGYRGDPLGVIYGLWRMKYTWQHNLPYYFNALVASPFGIDYSGVIRVPFLQFFAKWLTILTNEIIAYNLIILLSFPLAGITMYYLVHRFTKNKVASFFSGIIFAFSPYHFAHAWAHLGLANIQWMPLYVLLLFRLDENRTYGNAVLCAVAFTLNALFDPHYGYFMAVFTGAFLLFKLVYGWKHRRWSAAGRQSLFKGIKVGLVGVIVALAIILPFQYRTLKIAFFESKTQAIDAQGYVRPFKDLFTSGAKIGGYLLPAVEHPIFGKFTKKLVDSWFYSARWGENALYLGYVPMALAIVAIIGWRRRRRRRRAVNQPSAIGQQKPDFIVGFFVFLALVALVFSHAPWIEIGGFRILFPSYFMYKILPAMRAYQRFGILVMLSVSVLAGIGLSDILKKTGKMKWRLGFSGLVIVLVLFEFWNWPPYRVTDVSRTPPVYEWLAEQPGDFIIAEYPLSSDISFKYYYYLFWQRIHRKPLINGAMPGTYAEKVRKEIVNIADPRTAGILRWLGAKYVIFHPDKYLREYEATAVIGEIPDVSNVAGLRFVREFGDVKVYKVVAQAVKPGIR